MPGSMLIESERDRRSEGRRRGRRGGAGGSESTRLVSGAQSERDWLCLHTEVDHGIRTPSCPSRGLALVETRRPPLSSAPRRRRRRSGASPRSLARPEQPMLASSLSCTRAPAAGLTPPLGFPSPTSPHPTSPDRPPSPRPTEALPSCRSQPAPSPTLHQAPPPPRTGPPSGPARTPPPHASPGRAAARAHRRSGRRRR